MSMTVNIMITWLTLVLVTSVDSSLLGYEAASIGKVAHISEKLAGPIFLEYLDTDDSKQ